MSTTLNSSMARLKHHPPCLSSLNSNTISSITPIKSHHFKRTIKVSFSANNSNSESSSSSQEQPVDPVKAALEKAKAYKKTKRLNLEQTPLGFSDQDYGGDGVGNDIVGDGKFEVSRTDNNDGAKEKGKSRNGIRNEVIDIKKERPFSSMDFMGLEFADKKKTRGLPAGLVPISDPFPEGKVPEIEFIVGDTSKFDNSAKPDLNINQEDDLGKYKPKVSSWGVFPRPSNISQTYGGGRVIRPGEVLETAEAKAAKVARTKELVAAYKKKIGLSIDPKLKAECEKALNDGDALMDVGKLREALPYYEKVMDSLTFKSDLHGLAALQWSICQDSLRRSDEARQMYEKLQSHPNAHVNKKARHFVFSFQAMKMMKVTSSSFPVDLGYRKYFEAFVENKYIYPKIESEDEETREGQVLPYILFLVSPIFAVIVIAAQKGL